MYVEDPQRHWHAAPLPEREVCPRLLHGRPHSLLTEGEGGQDLPPGPRRPLDQVVRVQGMKDIGAQDGLQRVAVLGQDNPENAANNPYL